MAIALRQPDGGSSNLRGGSAFTSYTSIPNTTSTYQSAPTVSEPIATQVGPGIQEAPTAVDGTPTNTGLGTYSPDGSYVPYINQYAGSAPVQPSLGGGDFFSNTGQEIVSGGGSNTPWGLIAAGAALLIALIVLIAGRK